MTTAHYLQHLKSRLKESVSEDAWFLSHYRDNEQLEVDFVLESALREVIGIEVKAAASVQASDFKCLKKLRDCTGEQFLTGIVLYDGHHSLSFGDRPWAVPLRCV